MSTDQKIDYSAGKRFRVVKEGGRIWGMKPIAPYAQEGYRLNLKVGDILTSGGSSMTFGDGVPALKWRDASGEWICNDAVFEPVQGGMWGGQIPADGYLEPVD